MGEIDSREDVDGAEDVSTVRLEEFVVAVVVEASPVRVGSRLVCIVTGPEPKENSRDLVEQQSERSRS